MTTLNKVTLIGYLGHDPEMRSTGSGDAVAQVSLATTETWKDRTTGERKEATEWHRVVLYRRLAEVAGQYLKKGSQVYIEGRLQTRKWTGKDDIERQTVEIIADDMRMLGGRGATGETTGDAMDSAVKEERSAPSRKPTHATHYTYDEDAIPF